MAEQSIDAMKDLRRIYPPSRPFLAGRLLAAGAVPA